MPFNPAHYAEGVFRYLTGGIVHDFEPPEKRRGYHDASNGMGKSEQGYWFDWCIDKLGFVDPFIHWSERHTGGSIL